jgi:tetratricopeptide (TPR) repeat protein
LGIEMAASWLRSVPLTEIAGEIQQNLDFLATALRNVPDQHRNMRAVFDRSWHLLEQDEQQVLSRLAIFAGGYTRQAAQAVAGATLPVLAHLVDSSWLQMDQTGRYGIHELARQYTWEKLNEDPSVVERIRSAHSTYYATFAAEQSQHLNGAGVATATRALLAELDNLRRGWERAVATEDVLSIDRYAVPLAWLADARGFYREVMDRFDAAASLLRHRATLLQPHASAALAPQAALATLLHEMAFLSARTFSTDRGYELASEAVTLRRKMVDENPAFAPAYMQSLKHMAAVALLRGDLELYQTIRREIDAHSGGSADVRCTHADGALLHFQGRFEEAARLMAESSQECIKLGDVYSYAADLCRWSLVLCDMGRADEAWPLAVESERILTEVGHRVMASASLLAQAKVATIRQEYATAAKLLARCARLARETGNDFVRVRTCCGQGELNRLLGQFAAAKAQYQEAYDIADRIGRRHARTGALLGLAQAAYDLGELAAADTLFRRSLQDGWQRGLLPEVLGAIVGLAGLRSQDNRVTEAAEWLAVVIRHPACPILIKVEAQQMLGGLNRAARRESGEPLDVDNPVAIVGSLAVDEIVSALLPTYD